MRDVDVIIVHYATPELCIEAVESVLVSAETRQVLVVDNASPDGSGERLAQQFAAAPVSVLLQPRNLGFGTACNVAAREATGRYLFFLNSDARAEPGCLQVLRQRLEQDRSTGIVAPTIWHEEANAPQRDAQGDLPDARSILLRKTRRHRDSPTPGWVSGVALLARREEFLRLGGFEESFFLYFEDVELCRRYRRNGYEISREPRARVAHRGGQSRRSRREQKRQYDASQDRYLEIIGTPAPVRFLVRLLRRGRRWGGWSRR